MNRTLRTVLATIVLLMTSQGFGADNPYIKLHLSCHSSLNMVAHSRAYQKELHEMLNSPDLSIKAKEAIRTEIQLSEGDLQLVTESSNSACQ